MYGRDFLNEGILNNLRQSENYPSLWEREAGGLEYDSLVKCRELNSDRDCRAGGNCLSN